MSNAYEVAVVGAGLLGLATARELLARRPGTRLLLVDKEHAIARHQSGHNSGVIHSGLYYAPGSAKASLCVAGGRALYAFCEQKGIPVERCGKVVVAKNAEELPRLEALLSRGVANGVEGLERIGPERLRELEPHCVGVGALWSPNTGIVDFGQVAKALADEVTASGGEILLGFPVEKLERRSDEVVLVGSGGDFQAERVVVCAGLQSDLLARRSGGATEPKIVPFRGDYWRLKPARRALVRKLIYPVPDPAFPFLGVHFTRRMDGEVWLGPNAVWALAREGYGRWTVRPGELWDAVRFRGFRKLAARHWRAGLAELARDFSKRAFLRALRAYVPELELDDLLPGPSGVRAQAMNRDGALLDDFAFETRDGRVLHVRNAPSPAATSCLAIAQWIADRVPSV